MNAGTSKSKLIQTGKRSLRHVIFGRTAWIILLLLANFILTFSFLLGLLEGLPTYSGAMTVFTAVMLIYVLNSRDNPSIKLSWCVLISLLPLFGAVLYFYVRLDLGQRLNRRLIHDSIQESLPYLPTPSPNGESLREEDPNLFNLAHYLEGSCHATLYTGSTVDYFPLGEDKFQQMLIQMEQAEKFIFMEYFTISHGEMWSQILEVLERKASQGVEVRVMYDGMCAVVNLPYNYPKELEKLGIHCKMFSPLRPLASTHYNNRDHRKILVIDGHTAFTGGVNLEDRYINKEQVFGHWKDTAVMIQGPAAQGFTMLFLQMWNSNERQRIYEPYLTPAAPIPGAEGYVIPYGTNPTDSQRPGQMVYLDILNQAQNYVYIMTPYLILDSTMSTALCFAARRGVDVRLILPHIPDKKYAFVLAQSHYQELLEAGVKIFEYTPGFIHAKVFLSDDKCAVIGTINLDYRSLYLHHECAAYLYKVPALKDIGADFQNTLSQSQEITFADVKKRSLFSRLSAALLKAFAPLM